MAGCIVQIPQESEQKKLQQKKFFMFNLLRIRDNVNKCSLDHNIFYKFVLFRL